MTIGAPPTSLGPEMSTTALPAGELTFLFTDIEASSNRWEATPDVMRECLELHDNLVNSAVEKSGGLVLKHLGDGFILVFENALGALRTAVELQLRLRDTDWPGGQALLVRMGLHSGLVQPTGRDFFGPVVNRAARVMGAANGGQITCSEAVVALAPGIDAAELSLEFRYQGQYELRGVGAERLYTVHNTLMTTDSRPIRARISNRGRRPNFSSSFIGRYQDIRALDNAVSSGRVVSIVGIGGIGKTRLAAEFHDKAANAFKEKYWVSLDTVDADSDIAPAVVTALCVSPRSEWNAAQNLAEFLDGSEALVILDNCEHVMDRSRIEMISCNSLSTA